MLVVVKGTCHLQVSCNSDTVWGIIRYSNQVLLSGLRLEMDFTSFRQLVISKTGKAQERDPRTADHVYMAHQMQHRNTGLACIAINVS